ncbi:MAG: RNB domain-containing ribonuclease [Planctomycetota bacterium]|nr:RNB domain-containing ribonuclease [Planctomycetota bacterium]
MNVSEEAKKALAQGFASIAKQFQLPGSFAPGVLLAAEESSLVIGENGRPLWEVDRRDATSIPLVTLDPATSTDLDQAFAIERDGDDLVLKYALADVSAFVSEGGVIESEAWNRGVTIYGLSEKISLYPKVISQNAASLLPDGPRPAILVSVAICPKGTVALRSIERVVCASRAKLAYDTVDLKSIPFLEEFAQRMWSDEVCRGAIRVEFPQQEIVSDPLAPGGVRLELRARNIAESVNATLSLAANMAIASLFLKSQTGLFRVMDEPTDRALSQLRRTAHALGIDWPVNEILRDLQRRMDAKNMTHQRFLLEARRAGGRASYATYDSEKKPWHAAIAAAYVHATAPMRRLADRYVLDLAYLLANGQSVPTELTEKMRELPVVMGRGEGRASNVDRAVIDLLEAVSLQHRIGEILVAEVVDAEAGIVQTIDSAIRSKATQLHGVENGAKVRVRIDSSDPVKRTVRLTAVS